MTAGPTRQELAERVHALRAGGATYEQIALTLGISRSYANALAIDPTGEGDRRRKLRYRGTCRLCGSPTTGCNGLTGAPEICRDCAPTHYGQRYAAERRGHGPRIEELVAFCRQQPRRFMEITRALDITPKHAGSVLDRAVRYGLIERLERGLYSSPPR